MFAVRFHLGRGPHYKHWQIKDLKDKDVQVEYFDPMRSWLFMVDCELVCNEKKAQSVYQAGVKDVCGFIRCRNVYVSDPDILPSPSIDTAPRIMFNPIVDPVWRIEDRPGENWNNKKIDEIITSGSRCYLYCEALAHGA